MISLATDPTWVAASRLDGGFFAAPAVHLLSNGTRQYSPAPIRPQQIPRFRDGTGGSIETMVDLSYDSDNDGWEDKMEDLFPS